MMPEGQATRKVKVVNKGAKEKIPVHIVGDVKQKDGAKVKLDGTAKVEVVGGVQAFPTKFTYTITTLGTSGLDGALGQAEIARQLNLLGAEGFQLVSGGRFAGQGTGLILKNAVLMKAE